jgi:hypothetical protein
MSNDKVILYFLIVMTINPDGWVTKIFPGRDLRTGCHALTSCAVGPLAGATVTGQLGAIESKTSWRLKNKLERHTYFVFFFH